MYPLDVFSDFQSKSNQQLGYDLIFYFIVNEAINRGITADEDFKSQVIHQILSIESDNVWDAPLEKCLRFAARDNLETAGAMLREILTAQAHGYATVEEAFTRKRHQKHIAAKPRTKTKDTHKSRVIAEMRKYRKRNDTLQEFMDAAENGINDITISADDDGKYCIQTEAEGDFPTITLEAIKQWWKKARVN